MPDQTLQHCQTVPMTPPPTGPTTMTAGSPGDGRVEVTIDGGPAPDVPCGVPTTLPTPPGADVTLHYFKAEGGPDTIVVSW